MKNKSKYFKIILQMVKEYYKKYEVTPSFETLNQITRSELPQEMVAKVVLDNVKKIKDINIDGQQFLQEKSMKFCKQK
jgi:sulfur relay (sulfurtransferase) DsrC/TusE family protein